jgi:hypothetical protein
MFRWIGIALGLCALAIVVSVIAGLADQRLLHALVPLTVAAVILVVLGRQ